MRPLFCLLAIPLLCETAPLDNPLYRVWPVDWQHRVTRADLPGFTLPSLAIQASLGEWEQGAFVVRAKSALATLTVSMTDLINPATGRSIPHDSILVRTLEYAWTDSMQSSEIPIRLRNVRPLPLAAEENLQFWLILRCADNRDTGTFLGRAVITGDAIACSLDVSFRVLPLRLRDFTDFSCGAFLGGVGLINPATARDMKAHGMDAVQFFLGYASSLPGYYWSDTVKQVLNVGGHLEIEFHQIDSLLKFMKAAGMKGPVIPSIGNDAMAHLERDICKAFPQFQLDTTYDLDGKDKKAGPTDDPVFDTLIVAAVRQFKEKIESYGFEMVLLIYDEPTERFMPELADRHQLLHDAFPGLRYYGVAMDMLSWAREIAPYTDVIACNGSYRYVWQWAADTGKALAFYGGSIAGEEAGQARGDYGLRHWKYSPDFMFFWALNYYSGDPYVEYDGGAESGQAVLWPPPNHPDSLPVGSPAWEGLREAHDDWAYVKTLESMLAQATGVAAASIRPQANALRLRIADNAFSPYITNNYAPLDSIRSVVADWILEIAREEPGTFGDVLVGAEKTGLKATMADMLSASPNPFKTTTQIRFPGLKLPAEATLRIFDARGALVKDLTSETGSNQAEWRARNRASGLYIAVLSQGVNQWKKKLMLLK